MRSPGGRWRKAANVFVLGELASVALDREGCEAIQISIESEPAPLRNSPTENARHSDYLMPGSPKGKIACLSESLAVGDAVPTCFTRKQDLR